MRLIKIFLFIFFILLFVESVSALSVVVNVPEKYTNVLAGERVYFEIDLKSPENIVRIDLILEYKILNEKGEIIAQSKVLKAVETQTSFVDFIVIPDNTPKGLYFIEVNVKDYEELDEKVSASFQVIGKSGDLIIIILGIIFLGGLIYFSLKFRNFWKRILIRIKIKRIVRKRLKG